MKMTIQEIEKAVADYFGDTGRSRSSTLDGLERIASRIEGFCDALKSDIEKEDSEDNPDSDEEFDGDEDPELRALVQEHEDSTDEDESYKDREDLSNKEMDEAEIRSDQRERD